MKSQGHGFSSVWTSELHGVPWSRPPDADPGAPCTCEPAAAAGSGEGRGWASAEPSSPLEERVGCSPCPGTGGSVVLAGSPPAPRWRALCETAEHSSSG